jgi:hypothetical protein
VGKVLRFEEDKLHLMQRIVCVRAGVSVCVCVCVCRKLLTAVALVLDAAGGGDVIKVGPVLQQVYIPGKHHTNSSQNSHFEYCINYRWQKCSQPIRGLYYFV